MKKLKTGDVVRLPCHVYVGRAVARWLVVDPVGIPMLYFSNRCDARLWRVSGQRIAKVIKVCPKTVLVEISK